MEKGTEAEPWSLTANLEPGVSYYTAVYGQVPEDVDPKLVKICPWHEGKPCLSVGDLL
ncbi:hypothetical protein SAMN05660976_02490 [Nonomuraea pusilla]|uniref:Uncharacterized protein n=1 Tax=Nonomuraea pusilla TaxID=46177 RepID=A0A1H7QC72_9ACTN|nr:hypothetical protein SAMN05660976_02490 [Nonomuraea pusilla]